MITRTTRRSEANRNHIHSFQVDSLLKVCRPHVRGLANLLSVDDAACLYAAATLCVSTPHRLGAGNAVCRGTGRTRWPSLWRWWQSTRTTNMTFKWEYLALNVPPPSSHPTIVMGTPPAVTVMDSASCVCLRRTPRARCCHLLKCNTTTDGSTMGYRGTGLLTLRPWSCTMGSFLSDTHSYFILRLA